jgi:hypothetical protein
LIYTAEKETERKRKRHYERGRDRIIEMRNKKSEKER